MHNCIIIIANLTRIWKKNWSKFNKLFWFVVLFLYHLQKYKQDEQKAENHRWLIFRDKLLRAINRRNGEGDLRSSLEFLRHESTSAVASHDDERSSTLSEEPERHRGRRLNRSGSTVCSKKFFLKTTGCNIRITTRNITGVCIKCARTHVHTHALSHTHTHKHARTTTHAHTHKYLHTHTHTHTHAQAHTYIHTHTHTYTRIHTMPCWAHLGPRTTMEGEFP